MLLNPFFLVDQKSCFHQSQHFNFLFQQSEDNIACDLFDIDYSPAKNQLCNHDLDHDLNFNIDFVFLLIFLIDIYSN